MSVFDLSETEEKRREWKPTEAQFAAYLEKELEMARRNLEIAKGLPYEPRDWGRTLHSRATVLRALLT